MPQLYLVPLNPPAVTVAACAALLSGTEKAARDRFLRRGLGRRYAVAHGALRLLLGLNGAGAAAELIFGAEAQGKPFLQSRGTRGRDAPHFNLSHSEDLGCIALSRDAPVGVDVELARPSRDCAGILRRILDGRREYDCVHDCVAAGGISLHEAMLRCWTFKEAIVKAAGYGLAADPRNARLEPDALESLLLGPENGPAAARWTRAGLAAGRHPAWEGAVFAFPVSGGRGAVAVSGPPPPLPPRIRTAGADRLLRLGKWREAAQPR